MRVLLALVAISLRLGAQQSLSERGFEHFYNLEYEQALADFHELEMRDPKTPEVHNYVAQTLLFREMFRNGALESELVSGDNSFLRRPKLNPSPETEKEFLDEIAKAITLAQKEIMENPKDADAIYALGISYGLRANYYWVVKKAWRESLSDATAARRQHNRVSELQPGNVDARLVQGLHDYIVGSLPIGYRMLGFVVGIHGDRAKGIQTIQDVSQHGMKNRIAAQIFLCALYRRENQPLKAVPMIQELIKQFPRNYLLRLELSQMYSVAGDGTRALATVDDLAQRKSNRAPGFDQLPWEKVYYQKGIIQFWYRDLDSSLENLNKVAAAANDVDLNTGAQTFLRIGQIYDMTNRRPQALEAYKKCIAYSAESDAAHEAKKYLSAPYRRS
jgi:tetratricopeptide (TPR) repeat protein